MSNSDKSTERIEQLESRIDILRWFLLHTQQQTYALAVELAELKGQELSENEICKEILEQYNNLNTLRSIKRDLNYDLTDS
ncbi:hypothetical protein [Scytonema sp. PCC 10023]|uniref:hypothetical protein n=1 Tax=Scytonema sp. PCC 10023 TaxID=1680591 RepID=UPI0039C5DF23